MEYTFDDRGIQPKTKEALEQLAAMIPEDGGGESQEAATNVPAVSAPDASTAISDTYTQAEVQAIATLANANKAAINAVISALVTAGLMEGV